MALRRVSVWCCLASLWLLTACSRQPAPAPASAPQTGSVPEAATTKAPSEAVAETPTPKTPPTQPQPETPAGPFWPRFNGPAGNNISPDTKLLKKWPEAGPALKWTAEGLGAGFSSVSLVGGSIFTSGNIDGKTIVTALDLDGKPIWHVENGPAWTGSYEGTRSTPTVDGAYVYDYSPLGQIVCVNIKSGEPLWASNTLESFQAENIQWALAESLLVDGEHLICSPGGKAASVAALNKLKGDAAWVTESTGDKAGYASPTLAVCDGLRMILTMTAKALIGVHADTGKLLFRHPFATQYDVNALQPIYHDGAIFISGGYGTTGSELLKLKVSGDTATVEKVWGSRELDNQHGGVVLVDGYLYGAAHQFNHGSWVCLDWKTGEKKWVEKGVGKGSCTYADGLLYMLSEDSRVGLAKVSPEGLQLLSEFRLPPGGNGPSWAHPVVCGGRLYIRHDTRLFAYQVQATE